MEKPLIELLSSLLMLLQLMLLLRLKMYNYSHSRLVQLLQVCYLCLHCYVKSVDFTDFLSNVYLNHRVHRGCVIPISFNRSMHDVCVVSGAVIDMKVQSFCLAY